MSWQFVCIFIGGAVMMIPFFERAVSQWRRGPLVQVKEVQVYERDPETLQSVLKEKMYVHLVTEERLSCTEEGE